MEQGVSTTSAKSGLRTWRMQRVESIDANPRTFEQRATTFAAAVPDGGAVTLLVSRTERHGVVSQLLAPARFGDSGALALAQAVGAKAVPVNPLTDPSINRSATLFDGGNDDPLVETPDGILLPRADVIGWCERDPDAPVAHSVQAGANPAEVARLLAGSLQPGQWLAVVLRTPSNTERKAWRRWLVHRLGTANPVHHSLGAKPMVASILAGGDDENGVASLLDQVVASLPGFDLGTRVRVGELPWVRLGPRPGLIAVASFAAFLAVMVLTVLRSTVRGVLTAGVAALQDLLEGTLPGIVTGLPGLLATALPLLAVTVCVLLGASGFYRLRGHGSSWPVLAARALGGIFPRPKRTAGWVRSPRAEKAPDQEGNGGQAASEGDYPLHPAAFMFGPAVVAATVAPQGGALSGGAETRDRGVPPVLLSDIGPVIGTAPGGDITTQAVRLSAFDSGFGVAITGGPGTGKTKLMEGLWLADTLDRVQPSGRPGWPGKRNALVCFDTKGDEVPVLSRWARTAGDQITVVSVSDPSSWAVDMFALDPDPVQAATLFVDSMVYAFEAGSIMARSQETLTAVFAGALAADNGVCDLVPDLGPVRHPVRLAHVMCGGAGETLAKDLFGALRSEAARRKDRSMLDAVEKLKVLYEPFTSSAFRNGTEAARNKIDALLKLRGWWDTDRRRITWDHILTRHLSVVVDTGSGGQQSDSVMVDERSGNLLAGMLMFGLWTAMKRNCAGWREQNRWVSVYSDELAVQAATSAEPIAWMRDQGRSYGIRMRLATQRAEQLPQVVRDVFLTFPNLISYRQESVLAAKSVAENVSQGENDFIADDIRNLPPFTAVARLDVNRRLVPSFVVAVHNFEADPQASIGLLGYRTADGGSDTLAMPADVPAQTRPVTVFDDDGVEL